MYKILENNGNFIIVKRFELLTIGGIPLIWWWHSPFNLDGDPYEFASKINAENYLLMQIKNKL